MLLLLGLCGSTGDTELWNQKEAETTKDPKRESSFQSGVSRLSRKGQKYSKGLVETSCNNATSSRLV